MPLTYPMITDLVAQRLTAAQIATEIQTSTLHVRDTTTAQVFRLIVNEFKAARQTFDKHWTGPLVDAVNSSGNPVLIAGAEQLFTQPWSDLDFIRTASDPEVGYLATALTQLAQSVVQAPVTPQMVQERMDALTGGEKWRDYRTTTEADVQAVIDAEVQRLADADAAREAARRAKEAEEQRKQNQQRIRDWFYAKLAVTKEKVETGQFQSQQAVVDDLPSVFVPEA
ncbi:MAG: hypothetical protein RIK87_08390 [Fuerstiella sp.]